MSSYRQLLYHLVFRTKGSLPSIKQESSDKLYAYITGIIKNKNSHLYRINGTENHVHILTDIHPSFSLADFMREMKVATSVWMKESGSFPLFDGWAEGYGAVSCSYIDTSLNPSYSAPSELSHILYSFTPGCTGGYSYSTTSWSEKTNLIR